MTKTLVASIIMILIGMSYAMASDQFIKKLKLPSSQTVVIAEGEFEARSIGSFSVRLYQPAPTGDETTFFTSGLISARDGSIEKVVLSDIIGDSQPEIIVVVRSAGTGSYLSAHAFTISDGQKLILNSTVEGLQPEENPILLLKKLGGNDTPQEYPMDYQKHRFR